MSSVTSDSPLERPQREFRNIHISQIVSYRLPPSGMVSILHRVSGAALFLLLPALLWLLDLSLSSELSFARLSQLVGLWWMKLLLVAVIWCFMHHLVAGVRYLLLDVHMGIDKISANNSAKIVFGISGFLTLVAALRLFGVF